MERWGLRECVCAVELFIWTGSITETQPGFRRERNQQEAPSPNAIWWCVKQWREEGSVTCKKPPGRPSSVRTPDNLQNTSSRYAQLLNSCAPVHWGGWWPPKWHCTQKVKLCKKKMLSTIVNRDVLKLVSITFSKMLFLFIISSLFLPHPVCGDVKFSMFFNYLWSREYAVHAGSAFPKSVLLF